MAIISITSALDASVSALRANQQALGVISNNIANANSTGYSRELISASPDTTGGNLQGVALNKVIRSADNFLIAANRKQFSSVGNTQVLSDYYNRIQSYYGSPDSTSDTSNSGNSINDALSKFFSSINTLSSNTALASSRTAALNQGAALAQNISTLASNLENTRFQADQDIATGITYINSQIQALQSINTSIQNAGRADSSTAALLDQRDLTLQNIAEYMDINVNFQSDGEASVSTGGGITLLTPTIRYQLGYNPAGSVQDFTSNSILQPITVSQVNLDGSTTLTADQLVTGGISGVSSGNGAITNRIGNGKFAGLLQIRDSGIPQLLDQVNNIASNITDAVNAIQNNGAGFPPPNTLTGTRAITSSQQFAMSGNVMIGVTDGSGNPVASPYTNQPGGVPPLTLNLSAMNNGQPTVQDIVNAINSYYGPPPHEVSLGDLNNIQLQSVSDAAATGSNYTFNLKLSNYGINNADVQVTGVTVSGAGSSVVSGTPSTSTAINAGTVGNSPNVTVNFGGAGPWIVNATVQSTDAVTGVISIDTITYQVNPAASGLEGTISNFTNGSFGGDATIVLPNTTQPIARAQVVDANGNPVASGIGGFLQIKTINPANGIAISELDSSQLAQINPSNGSVLPNSNTGKAFSDFFQLNDFFVRDANGNSNALNMQVNNILVQNPGFISTGQLTASNPPANSNTVPSYTYSLSIGNNQAAINLAALQSKQVSFAAASGIPALNVTLSDYGSQVISFAAQAISAAALNASNENDVYNGLKQQVQSVSGVNIDQQMSDMLLYQNSYEASAKIITTIQSIFSALEDALR